MLNPVYTQGIILAGGQGTRLKSMFPDIPKSLVPIQNRPLIYHQLDFFINNGIQNIIICTGHRGEQIYSTIGTHYKGTTINYSHELSPMGTGGALANALNKIIAPRCVIINGDTLYDDSISINDIKEELLEPKRNYLGAIAAYYKQETGNYGTLTIDSDKTITAFKEKEDNTNGLVNAGLYLLQRNLIEDSIPQNKYNSLELDIFPRWAKDNLLYAYVCNTSFHDIGTPEEYTKYTTVTMAASNEQ